MSDICIRCKEPWVLHFQVASAESPGDLVSICPSATFQYESSQDREYREVVAGDVDLDDLLPDPEPKLAGGGL